MRNHQPVRPRDNREQLVRTVLAGSIAPPRFHAEQLTASRDGSLTILPGHGGITLGLRAGDPVDALLGDHLLPGVALEDADGQPADAGPLHQLSCVGNLVRDADGEPIGIVSGKRGGIAPGFWGPQHVVLDALPDVIEKLTVGSRVNVLAEGRGLALPDWPNVTLLNCSPWLLDRLPWCGAGGLALPVRAIAPSVAAGAGLGQDGWIGDLEIADAELSDSAGLRFGDLVAFQDVDSAHGRHYSPGYVSVGVVSHGPSDVPGHGPGVTILISGPSQDLSVALGSEAGLVAEALRGWPNGENKTR